MTKFEPASPPTASFTRFARGVRTQGWVDLRDGFEGLGCPLHHHIKGVTLELDEDKFTCTFKEQAGAPPCGIMVWILYNVRAHLLFAAEVDHHDMQVIRLHKSTAETMFYLGAPAWPRARRATRRRAG